MFLALNGRIIGMKGMLRFYWGIKVWAYKSLVEVIWHVDIDSFTSIIIFQLNSTEKFINPIINDAVVFF